MKAIVARKRRFTADFDSTSRLVSTENKLQRAPSQPPDAAGPTDPVLGTHGASSSPLLWRPPACLLETVEHSQEGDANSLTKMLRHRTGAFFEMEPLNRS